MSSGRPSLTSCPSLSKEGWPRAKAGPDIQEGPYTLITLPPYSCLTPLSKFLALEAERQCS